MVAALRSHVERQHMSYDVLHSHYWLSGVVALRFRDDPRVPVVHMFHTLSRAKELYAGTSDPTDSALRVDAESCVSASADVIVGATDAERKLLERLYGKQPQVYKVISPGVDLDAFAPMDKGKARAKLGIAADQVILFAGRLDPIKGLDVLLQSVADIRASLHTTLQVVVVGGSGEAGSRGTARYRHLARRLGIESIVDFRGPVSQADLPLYFSAADICAVPSAYESFGMVALEAMACQTPVVGFAVGGLEATVKDRQTGFLAAPGSRHHFSQALYAALTSPNLETMGRRARLMAHRFTWSGAAGASVAAYEEAASARLAQYEHVSSAC
jgi:D-inositol-3-phosphate glycosyltransferase